MTVFWVCTYPQCQACNLLLQGPGSDHARGDLHPNPRPWFSTIALVELLRRLWRESRLTKLGLICHMLPGLSISCLSSTLSGVLGYTTCILCCPFGLSSPFSCCASLRIPISPLSSSQNGSYKLPTACDLLRLFTCKLPQNFHSYDRFAG